MPSPGPGRPRRRATPPRGRHAIAAVAAAALVAACATPEGLAPQAQPREPSALATAQSLAGAPLSPATWPSADWWKSFGDPQLDALIAEALAGSPTLRAAEARTRRALALAEQAGAARYPTVDAAGSTMREHAPLYGSQPPPFAGATGTLNDLHLTLGWEVDLWGKNRAAYEAALGQAKVAEVDVYATRLALSTAIAQAYVELGRAFLQLDVAQRTLEEREHIYALTRDRNAAGLDSRLEVKQAEAALPATRERIAQLDEQMALARNQIAALLGAGPDRGLAIARPSAALTHAVALPSVLPAELLGRRPDLVAQRWRVESAAQTIDSAKAQFLPDVNLVALVGLQAFSGANLFTAASRMVSAGPALSLPIFDGGRLRGNLAAADADYDIAVEQYNQALADALREVVDQIASLASVREQRAQQRQALAAAQEAYQLALMRYQEGIGNYLQVLSAEQPLLEQRSLDADLDSRELALSIRLVRALGGGYEPAPVAVAVRPEREGQR